MSVTLDARSAECFVYTFKEGVLSAVAHDLKIAVDDFEVRVSGTESERQVSATFRADRLRVVSAMRDGVVQPQLLSARDRQKIDNTILREVLRAQRFPTIEFASTQIVGNAKECDVRGALSLCGVTREVQGFFRGGRELRAEVDQVEFGITPYSALLGALRIQSRVRIDILLRSPLA